MSRANNLQNEPEFADQRRRNRYFNVDNANTVDEWKNDDPRPIPTEETKERPPPLIRQQYDAFAHNLQPSATGSGQSYTNVFTGGLMCQCPPGRCTCPKDGYPRGNKYNAANVPVVRRGGNARIGGNGTVQCKCGIEVSRSNMSAHKKSEQHISGCPLLNSECKTEFGQYREGGEDRECPNCGRVIYGSQCTSKLCRVQTGDDVYEGGRARGNKRRSGRKLGAADITTLAQFRQETGLPPHVVSDADALQMIAESNLERAKLFEREKNQMANDLNQARNANNYGRTSYDYDTIRNLRDSIRYGIEADFLRRTLDNERDRKKPVKVIKEIRIVNARSPKKSKSKSKSRTKSKTKKKKSKR
jgi:hypothetical protein